VTVVVVTHRDDSRLVPDATRRVTPKTRRSGCWVRVGSGPNGWYPASRTACRPVSRPAAGAHRWPRPVTDLQFPHPIRDPPVANRTV